MLGPTNIPELDVVIDASRVIVWIGVAAGLWKVARALNEIYLFILQVNAERRMLLDDLWERCPEKKDDFYLAMGQSKLKKAFFPK